MIKNSYADSKSGFPVELFSLAKQVSKSEQTSFFSQTYVCLANNKLLPKMNLNKSETEAGSGFIYGSMSFKHFHLIQKIKHVILET